MKFTETQSRFAFEMSIVISTTPLHINVRLDQERGLFKQHARFFSYHLPFTPSSHRSLFVCHFPPGPILPSPWFVPFAANDKMRLLTYRTSLVFTHALAPTTPYKTTVDYSFPEPPSGRVQGLASIASGKLVRFFFK